MNRLERMCSELRKRSWPCLAVWAPCEGLCGSGVESPPDRARGTCPCVRQGFRLAEPEGVRHSRAAGAVSPQRGYLSWVWTRPPPLPRSARLDRAAEASHLLPTG